MLNEIKIDICRKHWQQLPVHFKELPTAKHLIAAVEIAESLIRENNRLEMECREHRLKMPNDPDQRQPK
jgi:hypothetical protein